MENQLITNENRQNRLLNFIRNTFIRYSFMVISAFIFSGGVYCFVLGNMYFTFESISYITTYTFLGGHLVSCSLFLMIYGYMGYYAAYYRNKTVLLVWVLIAFFLFLSRVILWIELAVRKITPPSDWKYFGGGGIELFYIIYGTIFCKILFNQST